MQSACILFFSPLFVAMVRSHVFCFWERATAKEILVHSIFCDMLLQFPATYFSHIIIV